MSTNVIDQLVVTLGLDASQFSREQKRAAAELLKTKESMKSTAVEMAGAFRRVGLEFAGIFFGIRGAGDIIHKFAELNSTMADLGYTSRQLGESASNLRLYQQIAEGFGGTASGVTQMVSGLEQGMFNLRYMGQMSGQMLAWMRFGGGLPATNAQGGIDVLKMVSDLRARLHGMGNVEKNQILTALGVSDGIRNAIMATRQQYDKWVQSQRESASRMAAGTQSAQSLQRAWRNLQFSVDGAAASVLTNLTPALKSMLGNLAKIAPTELENLAKWIKTHGPEVMAFFGELNDVVAGIAKSMGVIGTVGHYLFEVPGKAIGHAAGALVVAGRNNAGWLNRGLYMPTIQAAGAQYGLPTGLLSHLIAQESGYNPSARAMSRFGPAVGIAQLLLKYYPNAGKNPVADIYESAKLLAGYYTRFGSWRAALEAYNEGPTAYTHGIRDPGAVAYANAILAHTPSAAVHHTTQVQTGDITINTRATDAAGIAHDMHSEIRRKANVFQTPNGPN